MSFTLIIVIVTVLVSIAAFNNRDLEDKLILWPRVMTNPSEYYRLLTSGFIHADWNHLLMNMFTLYFCGSIAESYMGLGSRFVVLYLTGIVIASLPTFIKNRHNSYYRSLGASGGVAAVLFLSIYFEPWSKIFVFFIPMPSILFGVLYLGYEAYMSKRGQGNVNHDAHFWGSVYGLLFGFFIDPTHGAMFVEALLHPH